MGKVSSSNSQGVRVPKLRFSEFEGDWHSETLGKLGTFTKGAPMSKADIRDTGTPFILYGELYTTYSDVTYHIVRKTDKVAAPEQYSRIGDVIIPTSGETPDEIATATCVMVPNVILAGDLNIYRCKNIDGRIVSYIINHVINGTIARIAQGKSVVHIKAEELSKLFINYPSSAEQEKLISFLSLIDKRIEKQRQLVEALKSYKRGALSKLFPKKGETTPEYRFAGFTEPWERRKLGEVTNTFSGGTPPVGVRKYYGGHIPFIRSAEIHSDSTELFITEEGLNNSSARLVSEGDILYALYGATSGEVGRSKIKGAINQAILAIKPISGYDSEFISQWLQKSKQDIVDTFLQGGQGNLSGTIVKNLNITFPSFQEQQQIGSFFSRLDHHIDLNQRKLTEYENMKEGLLQQLFI